MLFPFLDRSLLDDHTASVSRWLVRSLASVLLLAPPPPHHDSSPEGGRGRGEAYDGRTDDEGGRGAACNSKASLPLSVRRLLLPLLPFTAAEQTVPLSRIAM